MEQLVFVGILVFFSVLEAIARKRKERGLPGSGPGEWDPGELESARRSEPTRTAEARLPAPPRRSPEVAPYDAEPSFDDAVEEDVAGRPTRAPQGSEGMVPNEVWEEILALARGGGAGRPVPAPPAPRPRPAPLPEPVHPVHLTHPKMGTPMRGRLSDVDAREPAPVNSDVLGAWGMIAAGRTSLRQAVLLSEILAPPAALRGDPYDPE